MVACTEEYAAVVRRKFYHFVLPNCTRNFRSGETKETLRDMSSPLYGEIAFMGGSPCSRLAAFNAGSPSGLSACALELRSSGAMEQEMLLGGTWRIPPSF